MKQKLVLHPRLEAVSAEIADHLSEIAKYFDEEPRLTLLVRVPSLDDADLLMTNDDLDVAIGAITKLKERLEPGPAPEAQEGVDDDVLSSLLGLAAVYVSPDEVGVWTIEQKKAAETWAVRVHARASDNDVEVPPKPEFLNAYPELGLNTGMDEFRQHMED